jgi:hypothetical protein
MFKKAFVSAALFALVSSNAFASEVSDFGRELIQAKTTIQSILDGSSVPDASGTVTPDSIEESGDEGGAGGWDFNDDAKANPMYRSSALKLGDAGVKFLESDSLIAAGQYARGEIKKTEACADVNIALVDLAVANHYAAEPGFSMLLKPFSPQLKSLYDTIRARRGVICL